ncbi:MAG: MBL fold metallo-hydrolase, partial [Gammaproteobacteria bacterium]|nr:MBL fold metallo-hydrolase [Gammaproteobacteria bacterium]
MNISKYYKALFVYCLAACGAQAYAAGPLEIAYKEIAPDIWLGTRPVSTRPPVEGNTVFIINKHDVVVVDSGGTPNTARQTIAKIKSLTDKPVSYVINTHWHGDHNFGNQVYVETFPGVELLAHLNTRIAMSGDAMNYLQDELTSYDDNLAFLRKMADTGEDSQGNPLPEALQERYRLLTADYPGIFEALREVRVTPPTM